MSNKIKQEIEKIQAPNELHERSRIGIQKAKSEMHIPKRRWFFVLAPAVACLLAVAFFVPNFSNKPSPDITKSESLLANDLHFDDKYYLNIWEFTITDTSKIKKIGEVQKANFLLKGSDIYQIEGYPRRDFIAVEDKNSITGYSIYAQYNGGGKPIPIPQDISYSRIKKIKVYKEKKLINVIEEESVRKFINFFEQEGPHNEFIVDNPPQYNILFLTDTSLGYKYPISEKDGEFGLPMSESKLPKEIAEYFIPKQ